MLLLAVGTVTVLAVYADAKVEWPSKIDCFEQTDPVWTESAAYDTPKDALNLPETLRGVISLEQLQWDPGSFVQAAPGGDAGQNSYGYTTPENAEEISEAGGKVIYTFRSPDGKGGESISYRVYGSISGSGNVWLACDEAGNINGVVRDIPVTWEDGEYNQEKPGQYTFTANPEGYAYSGMPPVAKITLNEPENGTPHSSEKLATNPPSGGKAQAGSGADAQLGDKMGEAAPEGLSPKASGSLPENGVFSKQAETAFQNLGIGNTKYIGDIKVRKISQDFKNVLAVPTGVVQLPGGKVAGGIDVGPSWTSDLKRGDVLGHCKYLNVLMVNGVTYDLEVQATALCDMNGSFIYAFSLNHDNGRAYLRVGVDFIPPHPNGTPLFDVTVSFHYAGSNTKAMIPSLAVGNTNWVGPFTESFRYEDNGYFLYSTTPEKFKYSTASQVWQSTVPFDEHAYWPTLWTYFTDRSAYTFQICNDFNRADHLGGSGLEAVMGTASVQPQSTSVSLDKQVIDPSTTFTGSKNFTFNVRPCNADGVVTGTGDHIVTASVKSQTCKTGSTIVSGFGNCTFQIAGTYYNLITENGGAESNWSYDNTRYLQTIVISQDKETLMLGQKVTYKNLTTGAAVARPVFTNRFYGPVSTSVSVEKKVADSSKTYTGSKNFTFNVQPCNAGGAVTSTHTVSAPVKTQACKAGSTMVSGFGTCTFNAPGTWYNLITETAGSEVSWDYDKTEYIQTVTVAKNTTTGRLGAAVTYKNKATGTVIAQPTFTNKFYGPANTSVSMKKNVTDNSIDGSFTGKSFTFNVRACNARGTLTSDHAVGTPVKTQNCINGTTVSGLGICSFPLPGTYYNLITETAGSESNWSYDKKKYIQTIVVTKNNTTGKMEAAVTFKNLATGAAVGTPVFTNIYAGTKAAVQVKKVVSNYDVTMAGQPFMMSLKSGVTAKLVLKNNETSRQLLPELTATKTFDISEAVPMEYRLTDITITNSGKGVPGKLTLTKAADGSITGGRVTINPGSKILLTVTNRFEHKGYFKARSYVENELRQ